MSATHDRLPGRYALVDIETTGGHAIHHRIIEIGIVSYEEGQVVGEWSSLVNPGVSVPAGVQAFTGISDAMVETAPAFEDLAADVRTKLEGRVFAAHNARFDHGFVCNEFRRLGERLDVPALCTVRLSRKLSPQTPGHSLDALIARHGLHCSARHRALGDARVLAGFLDRVTAQHGAERVKSEIDALLASPSLPPQLPMRLAYELPHGPGVYRFLGQGGAVLYVGKAGNIRARVLRHFADDSRRAGERRLARQIRDIDWTETAGVLGAQLLESRLVREFSPPGNRRRRPDAELHTIRLSVAQDRLEVSIEPLVASGRETFGIFRNVREAKRALERIAHERELCRRVLGLETGDGSCFAYQLGRCRGVCVGGEPAALHAARVRMALARERIRDWPFRGAIGVRERGLAGEEIHVLDAWRYVGTASDDGELDALVRHAGQTPFDVDVYRILVRELYRGRRNVVELGTRSLHG